MLLFCTVGMSVVVDVVDVDMVLLWWYFVVLLSLLMLWSLLLLLHGGVVAGVVARGGPRKYQKLKTCRKVRREIRSDTLRIGKALACGSARRRQVTGRHRSTGTPCGSARRWDQVRRIRFRHPADRQGAGLRIGKACGVPGTLDPRLLVCIFVCWLANVSLPIEACTVGCQLLPIVL